MGAKIVIAGAAFAYGDTDIWSGLDLEIRAGDTLCLLGPNGCGKTTLLNCIHGDLRLKAGSISVDGRPVASMGVAEMARKIGYVFQEHNAPFPYPALEVVRMGRGPHLGLFGTPSARDTEMAERIMDSMGILHLADKRYTEISGGERQLILIARTLCQEPEIILLDEPTSHLDFRNQALVLEKVGEMASQGLTIVMTTHFPNHAWLVSSRVAMMNHGRFVCVGSADEVMTENNLSHTYGIRVRTYALSDNDNGGMVRFCVPATEHVSR